MKKTAVFYLSLVLVLLSTSPAQALVDFGFKGGINNSKILFSPSLNFPGEDYLQGTTFGLFMTFNLGRIGLQPEVLYSSIRGVVWSSKYRFIPLTLNITPTLRPGSTTSKFHSWSGWISCLLDH